MGSHLRLGISITALKRTFAQDDDGLFNILTQGGDPIISQRGEFVVTQEAPISADFISTEDTLLTQDGNFISLNQNPLRILLLNHDAETTGRALTTQGFDGITTQDGRGLLTQRES